ncbi:flagellar motor protein [Algicola sagamiensis]|uniref:flagellar motor protein n=1 Tax=Algicola sagamiensis TaxID=163869 RepID=UPI0003720841|nr:flagellar motor protein [Algicola sagamiensis]
MDKLTPLGLLIAFVGVIGGFAVEGGVVGTLFHIPAFFIVFGGTLGATLLQSHMDLFLRALRILPKVLFPPDLHMEQGIESISRWSFECRQNGFLSLEEEALHEVDPFISKALNMLVDGVEPEILRSSLDADIFLEYDKNIKASKFFEAMGGYSPTIGIIGAVLGLIQAMTNLQQPELLGQGIATAFVATVYGVGFANFIYIPVANKLKAQSQNESLYKEMMLEGFCGIASGDNPRSIELKLSAYIR